ncbi:HENMT methyltransferase, partial [Polypterus senegalus]
MAATDRKETERVLARGIRKSQSRAAHSLKTRRLAKRGASVRRRQNFQLHEVKYPSYCDKRIFENALVNEITYWTEKIKKRFLNSTEQGDTKNNVQHDQESNENIPWCSRNMEKHCINWSVCKSADGYLEVQKHGDTIHIPLDQLFSILEVKKICSSVVRLKEALLEIEQFEIAGDNLVVCICDNEK